MYHQIPVLSRNFKSRLFALFCQQSVTLWTRPPPTPTAMAEATSSSKMTASDVEIDRLLKSEASALQRQVEVCLHFASSGHNANLTGLAGWLAGWRIGRPHPQCIQTQPI
jgi:hypothetical protein